MIIGKMLHVHCGDSSAMAMKAAKPQGDVMVWADLLHEGPLPAGREGDDLYPLRASFLARSSGGGLRRDRLIRRLRRQDEALARARHYRELVLWFDACLYDMCHLMRHLEWFDREPPGEARLSMVCLDDHPGVPDFRGLGQLQPQDFLDLTPMRQPVSAARIAAGSHAWRAFRAADPTAVATVIPGVGRQLPVLATALERHLRQFPSQANGLAQTSQAILELLAAGPCSPVALFRAVNARESRPFLGDTTFFWYVNRLLKARKPAVATADGEPLPTWRPPPDMATRQLRLTDYGQQLLSGDADWIADNGIDLWLGGCHLRPDHLWRWDATHERLTPGS